MSLGGCLALLGMVVGFLAFVVAALVVGESAWGDIAPHWPGGGYGFAVTVGLLLPCSLTAAAIAAAKAASRWKTERLRALTWATGAAACGGGTVLSCMLALTALPPKRRHATRATGIGESGWVNEQWPGIWAAGLGTTILCVAALIGIAVLVHRKGPR
ncbi:hypothetical protein [Streptomyces sp. bgisy100]|uniref:hypothetical protein n=1 Tax=Streptomyces sp. bgisy100 TaxID=3413783 RepID=UPI003D747C99